MNDENSSENTRVSNNINVNNMETNNLNVSNMNVFNLDMNSIEMNTIEMSNLDMNIRADNSNAFCTPFNYTADSIESVEEIQNDCNNYGTEELRMPRPIMEFPFTDGSGFYIVRQSSTSQKSKILNSDIFCIDLTVDDCGFRTSNRRRTREANKRNTVTATRLSSLCRANSVKNRNNCSTRTMGSRRKLRARKVQEASTTDDENNAGHGKITKSKSMNGKCHNLGPITRNPYLNFLRDYRKEHCGLTGVQMIQNGAKEWNVLPKIRKLEYVKAAFYAKKRISPAQIINMCRKYCAKQIAKNSLQTKQTDTSINRSPSIVTKKRSSRSKGVKRKISEVDSSYSAPRQKLRKSETSMKPRSSSMSKKSNISSTARKSQSRKPKPKTLRTDRSCIAPRKKLRKNPCEPTQKSRVTKQKDSRVDRRSSSPRKKLLIKDKCLKRKLIERNLSKESIKQSKTAMDRRSLSRTRKRKTERPDRSRSVPRKKLRNSSSTVSENARNSSVRKRQRAQETMHRGNSSAARKKLSMKDKCSKRRRIERSPSGGTKRESSYSVERSSRSRAPKRKVSATDSSCLLPRKRLRNASKSRELKKEVCTPKRPQIRNFAPRKLHKEILKRERLEGRQRSCSAQRKSCKKEK